MIKRLLSILCFLLLRTVSAQAAAIPEDTWIAIRNPTHLTGPGFVATLYEKHMTASYSPKSRRLYFTGGDTKKHFIGPNYADLGSSSYYQGTHSLDLNVRLASPGQPNAGYATEHAYCVSSPTEVQPKRPDFVGFTWASWLDRFVLMPGLFYVGSTAAGGNCPGETEDYAPNLPNYPWRVPMTFDVTTRQWEVLSQKHGVLYHGGTWPWHSYADPVTKRIIRIESDGDLLADHYDPATDTWTYYRSNGNRLSCNVSHLAVIDRTIYCVDREHGLFGSYHIDTHVVKVVGSLPGSVLPIGAVPTDKGYVFAVGRKIVYAELDGTTFGATNAYRIWTWSPDAPVWSRIDTLPWKTLDGEVLPAGEMPRGTSGAVDTDTGILYLTGEYGGTANYSWAIKLSGGVAPPPPPLRSPLPPSRLWVTPPQLPVGGTWIAYPNSVLRPAMGNAPWNPRYIFDYSGGWFDVRRGELGVWGGGHADYPGNEVCTFTPVGGWVCGPRSAWVDDPTTETTADGSPSARHTFSCIVRVDILGWDGFFCHGGSLWRAGWPTAATWFYHRLIGAWERLPDIPLWGNSLYSSLSLSTWAVFDEARGNVLMMTRNKCVAYNLAARTWSFQGWCEGQEPSASAAFDPERRVLFRLGHGYADIWDTSTVPWTRLVTALVGDQTPRAIRAPGLVFDPVGQRYIAYAGGRDLYSINRDTWEVTKFTGTGADPGPAYPVGTHGRFQYVPASDGLILVNSVDGAVFYFQLAR